jgi:1-acyl-sn-glycerol-3-phosphate acyltransferase
MEDGHGVLITPNHPSHADAFALQEAADRLGTPMYFMTAWQVFAMTHRLGRHVLRRHGCFSINREGHDLRAFRQAVEVLERRDHPLVIFPEGEVFHLNDRTMPFRRGAATAALRAVRRGGRPVACVPCGIKFEYVTDPTPRLLEIMARLERRMSWTPRPDLPLARRLRRFMERMLSIKEVERFGETRIGSARERQEQLLDAVLSPLELRHGLAGIKGTLPERVKQVRRVVISRSEGTTDQEVRDRLREDMDSLFLVMQVFSYPADYLCGSPSIERIAETLDKLEEDVLGVPNAGKRGVRRATVAFGEPVRVGAFDAVPGAARWLTDELQDRVQGLIDEIGRSGDSRSRSAAEASVRSSDESAVPMPLAG